MSSNQETMSEESYENSSSYSSSSSEEEEEYPEPIKYVFWNGFLLHQPRDEIYIRFKLNELEEDMFGNKFFKKDKYRILLNEMIKISNLLIPHMNDLLKIDENDLDLKYDLIYRKYGNSFDKKPENIEITENYKRLQECQKLLKDYETKIKFEPELCSYCLYLLIKVEKYDIKLELPVEIAGNRLNIEINCERMKIKINLVNYNYIFIDEYDEKLSQLIYDIYNDNFDD